MSQLEEDCASVREYQERIDAAGLWVFMPYALFSRVQAIGAFGIEWDYVKSSNRVVTVKLRLSEARKLLDRAKENLAEQLVKVITA